MRIIEYTNEYQNEYVVIIRKLWSDVSIDEINEILENHFKSNDKVFLAIKDDKVIGFLNTAIRTDYVEGSESNKTGYIEGIYVSEECRMQAVAKKLLHHAFKFYKSKGITEVGSDVELDNVISQTFHEKVGFKEASRNVHYIMKLK